MPAWLSHLAPILLLLAAVGIVVMRLPKIDVGHGEAFKKRRLMNWVPLGLTYAFLYFGRYNLSAIVSELDRSKLLSKAQFNEIDGVGAWVYGIAFLVNGPLTDRLGGRFTILLAAGASALANVGMGIAVRAADQDPSSTAATLREQLMLLNAINMYFQSFGAVSIVKVNAPWFHVRERGILGGLFGILISLGLYFAYDWSLMLAKLGFAAVFWCPAAVLAACVVMAGVFVRDTPSAAGFEDFDTGDATSGQVGTMPAREVVRRMFSQRVIWVIVAIEFCSGFLRQAVMKQYRPFAKAVGADGSFVYQNWGMLLCVAGILGGVFAGFISDHVFQSRRGPVASVLYAGLLAGCAFAFVMLDSPALGWSVVFMSLCVIGVHGMLSGTASMDFGGSKNAGIVTGVIDGFVYLGTGAQAFYFASALPTGGAAKSIASWKVWPGAMVPVAVFGLALCATIWNARPTKGSAGGPSH